MVKLSFQDQSCDLTLEEGLEEYRAYLQANGKKQLIDKSGSQVIRDHDATHVIFGLDTSIAVSYTHLTLPTTPYV